LALKTCRGSQINNSLQFTQEDCMYISTDTFILLAAHKDWQQVTPRVVLPPSDLQELKP